ncbi:MAG: hypothetical protein U0V48_06985 [Anaerolineales bacterium]
MTCIDQRSRDVARRPWICDQDGDGVSSSAWRSIRANELLDIAARTLTAPFTSATPGLEFAERLAISAQSGCADQRRRVSGLDEHHWREWAVPPEWAGRLVSNGGVSKHKGTTPHGRAPYQTEASRPKSLVI